YGDGTTMNLTSGAGRTEKASDGTSTLIGTNNTDTFYGGTGTTVINADTSSNAGGDDVFVTGSGTMTIYGGTGQDTYSYVSGAGRVWIEEFGGTADLIKLGSGLTSSNVQLSEDSAGNDLWITDGVSGDKIEVLSHVGGGARVIEKLQYGDGST